MPNDEQAALTSEANLSWAAESATNPGKYVPESGLMQ